VLCECTKHREVPTDCLMAIRISPSSTKNIQSAPSPYRQTDTYTDIHRQIHTDTDRQTHTQTYMTLYAMNVNS